MYIYMLRGTQHTWLEGLALLFADILSHILLASANCISVLHEADYILDDITFCALEWWAASIV
jgi:hypothetical protein